MSTAPPPPAHSAAASTPRRLLILDDDEMVGVLVQTVARLDGAATRLARDSADFFAALDDWQPTHLVIDLTMPVVSGEDVLRALAARGCNARVIVASGHAERLDDALQLAAALGLAHVARLPKPFFPAQLRALLAEG